MKLPKFDWKNIDWMSTRPSKERIVFGLAVLLVGVGLFYFGKFVMSGPAASGQ